MQKAFHFIQKLIVAVFLLFGYWYWTNAILHTPLSAQLMALKDHDHIQAKIHNQEYIFEVVNSKTATTQGLSDRKRLDSDGMLFVYEQKNRYTFWMLRMHFDLDLVWLDDHTIVQIMPNVKAPPPQTPPERLQKYTNTPLANFVLEMPSGSVKKMGLKVGDQFLFNTQPIKR